MTVWKYTGIEHSIVKAGLKADPSGCPEDNPTITRR
jgi:hypothetical protein